jgi:biotin carboxylase
MSSRQKWIHILGAGAWQVSTIRLARDLGCQVLVTDMYRERPGYALADAHEVVDITDREATLAVAARYAVSGIVCDTTDVGVPTMAWVAEQLGLPGIGCETALNFTNKHLMRTLTAAAGVPNPRFALVRSLAESMCALGDIGLPAVVKPVNNQSSRGVHVLRNLEQLDECWADARRFSRTGDVLVESFIAGTEVTVEGVCLDGDPLVVGISDKDHFGHRPEVANRLTYPAALADRTLDRIRSVNATVVRALGLRTGVTHAEYMVADDDVYLIEIAARGAGSFVYSHIVPWLAGIPVPALYLRAAMGERWTERPRALQRAANLAFFDFPSGRVVGIEGVDRARREPGVQEVLLEFSVGDVLAPPTDDRSRHGLVVVFGETRQEVLERTEQVKGIVKVRVA